MGLRHRDCRHQAGCRWDSIFSPQRWPFPEGVQEPSLKGTWKQLELPNYWLLHPLIPMRGESWYWEVEPESSFFREEETGTILGPRLPSSPRVSYASSALGHPWNPVPPWTRTGGRKPSASNCTQESPMVWDSVHKAFLPQGLGTLGRVQK